MEDSLFKRCNPAILGQRIPANSTLHLPLEKELLFYHYEEELYLKYNEHITRDSIARVQEDSIRQIQTAEKANKTANGTANSKGSTITYVVKKGDVLGKIAGKYHVSVADIKRWNNLKSDLIQIGQKLTIKQ